MFDKHENGYVTLHKCLKPSLHYTPKYTSLLLMVDNEGRQGEKLGPRVYPREFISHQ